MNGGTGLNFWIQRPCSRAHHCWSFLMKIFLSSLIKGGDSLNSTTAFNLNFVFKENLSVIFGPILSLAFINYLKSVHISVISILLIIWIVIPLIAKTWNAFFEQMCLFYTTVYQCVACSWVIPTVCPRYLVILTPLCLWVEGILPSGNLSFLSWVVFFLWRGDPRAGQVGLQTCPGLGRRT